MTEPGWYPDPWQPGGWRWHDGTDWTSWTGPPPRPPGMPTAPTPGMATAVGTADLGTERRARPWAEASIIGLAVALAIGAVLAAAAFREMLHELVELFREGDPTNAEIERAVDAAVERQDEFWWLNIVGFVPLAFLAGMAVWTNRVVTTATRLGYRVRRGTGWAAAGWFVPIVNFWFPYQSIVDSISPHHPDRGRVLAWWLLYVLGGLSTLPVLAVGVFTDASLVAVAPLPIAVGVVQAVYGLRLIALVHEDHAAAAGRLPS